MLPTPTPGSRFFAPNHHAVATVAELVAEILGPQDRHRWLVLDTEGQRWALKPHDCLCHPQVRYVGTKQD